MNAEQIPVAVYTRKSTDAHTEQEVHSLSVQRASSESFISSQKHLKWELLEEHFDDNNISGATLERPGLDRLKMRILEGKVKVVVIHRLDRISRSLSQFLELMDFLDAHGVALVSVTQNFNTGDSMGKLMVSIIMSFAEFERSLIRDRVTERIHAARKKGRFVGGRPVLGYNIKPSGGELEVDPLEAIRVKEIFQIYLKLNSVKACANELNGRGWHNKQWITKTGKASGGAPFSPNGLHNLLTNSIYIGKVTLKGDTYEGKHDPIIEDSLFERVQSTLKSNSVQDANRRRNQHSALLKGLLCCSNCQSPFIHTYTKKKGRTYRYYTCQNRKENGIDACNTPSLPAGEIESLVESQILQIAHSSTLQELVFEQIQSSMKNEVKSLSEKKLAARQQLNRLDRELSSSRGLDAPLSLIRHLETKRDETENLLEDLERQRVTIPTKVEITARLQNIDQFWPNFDAREKCRIATQLLERVDYDNLKGKVTLKFKQSAFLLDQNEEIGE